MRFSTLALSVLILTFPAGAMAQSQTNHHHGMGGFLTPQQRFMYIQEMKAGATDWKSMSHDQRRAQKQALRAKFRSMSNTDRAKLQTDLQAKYDALPADRKQAVDKRIAERKAHRDQMRQNRKNGEQD